eukprot:769877-Pleurochrysis_carterae.AAC.1
MATPCVVNGTDRPPLTHSQLPTALRTDAQSFSIPLGQARSRQSMRNRALPPVLVRTPNHKRAQPHACVRRRMEAQAEACAPARPSTSARGHERTHVHVHRSTTMYGRARILAHGSTQTHIHDPQHMYRNLANASYTVWTDGSALQECPLPYQRHTSSPSRDSC